MAIFNSYVTNYQRVLNPSTFPGETERCSAVFVLQKSSVPGVLRSVWARHCKARPRNSEGTATRWRWDARVGSLWQNGIFSWDFYGNL